MIGSTYTDELDWIVERVHDRSIGPSERWALALAWAFPLPGIRPSLRALVTAA